MSTNPVAAVGLLGAGLLTLVVWLGYEPPRSLVPVATVVAVAALATVAFLDPAAVDGGRRDSLEHYGVAVAGALAITAAVVLLKRGRLEIRHRGSSSLDGWLLGVGALSVFGLFVGVVSGNTASYLIGDLYRLLVLLSAYMVAANTLRIRHMRSLLWVVGVAALVMQTRDVAVGASLIAGGQARINSVMWMHNLVGVAAWATLASSTGRFSVRFLALGAVATLVGIAMLSSFRAYALLLVLLLATLTLTRTREVVGVIVPLVLVVATPLIITVQSASAGPSAAVWQPAIATLQARIFDTSLDEASTAGRIIEMNAVREELSESGGWVFGRGLGAEYRLPNHASPYALSLVSEDGSKHFIHNVFAAAIFRHGIPGLLVFTGVLTAGLLHAWRGWRATRNPEVLFLYLTLLVYVANAPLFNEFIGDVVFGFALGATAAVCRDISVAAPVADSTPMSVALRHVPPT